MFSPSVIAAYGHHIGVPNVNWNDVSPAVTSLHRMFLGEFQVDSLQTLSPRPPLGKPVVAIIVQIGRMEFPPCLDSA